MWQAHFLVTSHVRILSLIFIYTPLFLFPILMSANRAVEVDEMWRAREKERELETKHRSRSKERSQYHRESSKGSSSYRSEHEKGNQVTSCSSRNPDRSDCYSSEDQSGLQDDEIEQFLRSRLDF